VTRRGARSDLRRIARIGVCAIVALASCARATPSASFAPVTNATAAADLPTSVQALPTVGPEDLDRLLADLHGTPVVLNFWASWCIPCQREAPALNAAHERVGDRVQFLGVNMQDARDGALRFLSEHRVGYPSLFDPMNAIGLRESLFAPPMTIVFDADGQRVATLRGEVSATDLDAAIALVTG
jgi:thiol:disulfide interchange protein